MIQDNPRLHHIEQPDRLGITTKPKFQEKKIMFVYLSDRLIKKNHLEPFIASRNTKVYVSHKNLPQKYSTLNG